MPNREFIFTITGRDNLSKVINELKANFTSFINVSVRGVQAVVRGIQAVGAATNPATIGFSALGAAIAGAIVVTNEMTAAGLRLATALEAKSRAAGLTSEEFATLDFIARRTGTSISNLQSDVLLLSSSFRDLTDQEKEVLASITQRVAGAEEFAAALNLNAEAREADAERIKTAFAATFGGAKVAIDDTKTSIVDFFADLLAGDEDIVVVSESMQQLNDAVDRLKQEFGLTEDEAITLRRQLALLGIDEIPEVTERTKDLLEIYGELDPGTEEAVRVLKQLRLELQRQAGVFDGLIERAGAYADAQRRLAEGGILNLQGNEFFEGAGNIPRGQAAIDREFSARQRAAGFDDQGRRIQTQPTPYAVPSGAGGAASRFAELGYSVGPQGGLRTPDGGLFDLGGFAAQGLLLQNQINPTDATAGSQFWATVIDLLQRQLDATEGGTGNNVPRRN